MRRIRETWEWIERWVGRVHVLDWALELFGWRQFVVAFILSSSGAFWAFLGKLPTPLIAAVGLSVFAATLAALHYGLQLRDRWRIKSPGASSVALAPQKHDNKKNRTSSARVASQDNQDNQASTLIDKNNIASSGEDVLHINWHTLYRAYADTVRLRFEPDSRNLLPDCILLLLLGYEVIFNIQDVPFRKITDSLPVPLRRMFEPVDSVKYNAEVIAKEHLSTYVERVRLAEGGYLRLNNAGRKRAHEIASDLISRA